MKLYSLIALAFNIVGVVAKINPKDVEKDIPYISCQVCKKAVDNLYTSVQTARNEAPYKKLDEGKIQEIIEVICDPDNKGGEWLRKFDIVQQKKKDGTFLVLEEPGGVSKCETECSTIVKSCKSLLNEIDLDDLSAALWKNKLDAKELRNEVCKSWTDTCSNSAKPITHVRFDEQFRVISEKDLQMEQLMASMKAAGMGGMSMYNKDDMENMAGGMGGYGDMDGYGDPYAGMGDIAGMGGMGGLDPYGGDDVEF